MSYRKLFLKMVRRDELLLEAEEWNQTLPQATPEAGEAYLKAARLTAEIASSVEELEERISIPSSIQRSLALSLFRKGGLLCRDLSEHAAYQETLDNLLRVELNAQLDKIDQGEEEMIPFEEVKARLKEMDKTWED